MSEGWADLMGLKTNQDVTENPTKVNKDAESEWLVEIELEDADELEDLLNSKEYEEYINAE